VKKSSKCGPVSTAKASNCRNLHSELPNPAGATKKEHLINSTTFENVPLMGKNDQLALTAKTKKTRRTNTKQAAKD